MLPQDNSSKPGTTQCFMISDISNVWVLVNVYQKDLPYVRVGDHGHNSNRQLLQRISRAHFLRSRVARSQHAHFAGAHRNEQSRREAEKGYVRDCHA